MKAELHVTVDNATEQDLEQMQALATRLGMSNGGGTLVQADPGVDAEGRATFKGTRTSTVSIKVEGDL